MKKIISVILTLWLLSGTAAYASEPEAAGRESTDKSARSSIFDLLTQSDLHYEVDMAAYYLNDLISAAAAGKATAGRAAEQSLTAVLTAQGREDEAISFDDLYLLSRIIYSEAGSSWLEDDFRLCVGEVVMNRVASPEFPDTIHDVIYQKGQYSVVNTAGFASLAPGDTCVSVALRLLNGERLMVPSVVYQSDYIQGELFTLYSDYHLGNTYFCVSDNLELYPID